MKKQNAEAALEALKKALKRGDEVGAYLCCGQLLGELLALCYPADAPPLGERFVRLPETELGQKLRPNLEAYARLCRRLDGVFPDRDPETYPQVADACRLLSRIVQE